jgi:hypothetical protein
VATLIPQSLDVVIQDKIVEILKNKSDEQSAIDPNVVFYVEKNIMDSIDQEDNFPLVNVWIQTVIPKPENSAKKTFFHDTVSYVFDLYVNGNINDPTKNPSQVATDRLLYLKEQVRFTLMSLKEVDFGFPVGTIPRKNPPRWETFTPEISISEKSIVAGRWTFDVEYVYSPEDLELANLKELNVSTDLWAALFVY